MALHLAEHVAWRENGGETFVIDLRNNTIYGLNSTAGVVWRYLEEAVDLEVIKRSLAESYGPTADSRCVGRAVREFVGELLDLGLLSGTMGRENPSKPEAWSEASELEPPRISWQEELRAFGFSCGKDNPGIPACVQNPGF